MAERPKRIQRARTMTPHQQRAWDWYRSTRATMERPGQRCSDESWAAMEAIRATHEAVRFDYSNALADHAAGRPANPEHLSGALDIIAVQLAAE